MFLAVHRGIAAVARHCLPPFFAIGCFHSQLQSRESYLTIRAFPSTARPSVHTE
jgi:hypothetical protein